MKKEVCDSYKVDRLVLEKLCNGDSVGRFRFVEKCLHSHSGGFFIDSIVFERMGEYYKFLEIKYLDTEVTYTVPFRVFPKAIISERTTYTNVITEESDNI